MKAEEARLKTHLARKEEHWNKRTTESFDSYSDIIPLINDKIFQGHYNLLIRDKKLHEGMVDMLRRLGYKVKDKSTEYDILIEISW